MIIKEIITLEIRQKRILPKLLATYHSGGARGENLQFKVEGGLHFIRGNSAPYFTLTADVWDHGSEFGGCCHELILEHFPEFADLAALHLSDMEGVPMHAVENAFYHMGGCTQFRPHPVKHNNPSLGIIWSSNSDREPYGAKWDVVASHLRITEDEARQLATDTFGVHFSPYGGFLTPTAESAAKARLSVWCDTQKPRWKAEADACIAKHELRVFGDKWITEREVA